MAGFLYYLPGQETLTLDAARSSGWAYALEGPEIFARGVARGPEGGERGIVFADPKRVEQGRIGYYPDRQTWRAYPGRPGVFAGFDREQPPEPADLARETQLDGHLVKLADGREWLAPCARGQTDDDHAPQWYCALPGEITVNDDGRWIRGDVLPQYAELWRRAQVFWDEFAAAVLGGEKPTEEMSDEQLSDLALYCLSLNYVIGKAELRHLKLFDVEARSRVLGALVDWPTLRDWLKKKRQAAADG